MLRPVTFLYYDLLKEGTKAEFITKSQSN